MNFDRLRALQDKLVADRIPGNDCIIRKDRREVYRYMTGFADMEQRREMRGDELYFFWSATKVITTSLGMRLHEEGKFLMTDPLSEYMPEFKEMTVRKMIDGKEELVPAEKQIKVGQLFNMTAGFDYNFATKPIAAVREETDGRCPTREIVRAIAKSPLLFEPGSMWAYSLCHDVLGGFIEVIAGKRLRDFAREVLFDPLGMEDTCYNFPSDEKKARMAVQYTYREDLGKCLPTNNVCQHILGPEYDSGGAGVISSCADYMKFADTIANYGLAENGYRYLSPASIDLWRSNTLDSEQIKAFVWPQLNGYGYGYGVRTMMNPAVCGGLSPVGEFGWGGAAGVWVIIDPKNSMSLVYTQHMLGNNEEYIAPRLRNVAYACLEL
ncbi:MAG: beta-lactamase family protein [Ruminococcaceae bacterium]|nr:beta-lactamase family protein [Oscillospiraceae bacterium]